MVVLTEATPVEVEILSLWLADAALAQRLGWGAPVPLLATTIAHPALPRNGRPRPSDADWADGVAGAYALAAPEAYALAADLSRRAERLLAVEPKLRAKGGRGLSRCCSPTNASRRRPRRRWRGSPIARAAACSIG